MVFDTKNYVQVLKTVLNFFWVVIPIALLFSCSSVARHGQSDILLADPTILSDQGKYYLYGSTSGGKDSTNRGFLVYESNDLLEWKGKGYALRKGDAYGDTGFWAPHVVKRNGIYYMIYTANEQLALAESKSPLGPFVNQDKHHFQSDVRLIDPYIFFDDGKSYLFHVRRIGNNNEIFVAELEQDLRTLKEGTLTKCLSVSLDWEDSDEFSNTSVQGPSVVKLDGKYYLFYSANNFKSPYYAVGYATSPSPVGPWIKPSNTALIDRGRINENGPGHGDVFFQDDKKKLTYVFHTHHSKEKLRPRKTGMLYLHVDTLEFKLTIKEGSFRYLNFSNK
jgi:beta-xylosidase